MALVIILVFIAIAPNASEPSADRFESPGPAFVARAARQSSVAQQGAARDSAWSCPASHPIKGNFTTHSGGLCIHHMPGGQFYGRTNPERCYATEADAQEDACRDG